MLSLRLKEQGDTIVEVMIAIAIVSLVLATAYGVSNRNTLAIQAAQEQEQAQHLAESQIEALRTAGSLDTQGDCFDGTDESSACDDFSASGSGATYKIHITGPSGAANAYTIVVKWTSLTGTQADNSDITMYYRLN